MRYGSKWIGFYCDYDYSQDKYAFFIAFLPTTFTDFGAYRYKRGLKLTWYGPQLWHTLNQFHDDPFAIRSENWTGIKTSPIATRIYWEDWKKWLGVEIW